MAVLVWILGDQLLKEHPALIKASSIVPQKDIRVLLIESQTQVSRYPYHVKKLALLLSAMQHYAEELRSSGFQVDFLEARNTLHAIKKYLETQPISEIYTMTASSKRGQAFQQQLSKRLDRPVTILPNTQFLYGRFDPFPNADANEIIRQEKFYRAMRKHFNLLMDGDGQPLNGQWNFDAKNRQPLPKNHQAPKVIRFTPDPLTQQAIKELTQKYKTIGDIEGFDLAVSRTQADRAAEDFFKNRLAYFGTYEDAMSSDYDILYHSKLSAYINVGLLDPLELAKRAEQAYWDGEAALNNVEGFIRQVVGWREYMYWQYQRFIFGRSLGQIGWDTNPLPGFFWNGKTNMNCLKTVIARVLESGYCHHIERLMILTNFCLLASISPEEVYNWFSSAFIDAYEWVMMPNVYGMGLYTDGGQIATKPYISSANYINKMSDYCQDCPFDKNARRGKNACPFNFLYWHYLIRNEASLRNNYRMARTLYHLKNFTESDKSEIFNSVEEFFQNLE
jgi:deoxyribodipyrimidine photolyase-related protein